MKEIYTLVRLRSDSSSADTYVYKSFSKIDMDARSQIEKIIREDLSESFDDDKPTIDECFVHTPQELVKIYEQKKEFNLRPDRILNMGIR